MRVSLRVIVAILAFVVLCGAYAYGDWDVNLGKNVIYVSDEQSFRNAVQEAQKSVVDDIIVVRGVVKINGSVDLINTTVDIIGAQDAKLIVDYGVYPYGYWGIDENADVDDIYTVKFIDLTVMNKFPGTYVISARGENLQFEMKNCNIHAQGLGVHSSALDTEIRNCNFYGNANALNGVGTDLYSYDEAEFALYDNNIFNFFVGIKTNFIVEDGIVSYEEKGSNFFGCRVNRDERTRLGWRQYFTSESGFSFFFPRSGEVHENHGDLVFVVDTGLTITVGVDKDVDDMEKFKWYPKMKTVVRGRSGGFINTGKNEFNENLTVLSLNRSFPNNHTISFEFVYEDFNKSTVDLIISSIAIFDPYDLGGTMGKG